MSSTYAALAALFLSCLLGRCLYEILKHSGRVDPTRRLVFAVVFADMSGLWVAWFAMGAQDPSALGLPPAARWVGLAAALAGLVLFVGAVVQLRGLENTKVLVTSGFFAKTRHPAYLGFTLWFLGWPLFKDAAVSLALAAVGIAATAYWRHNEEQALAVQFGEAYREYRRRTWF